MEKNNIKIAQYRIVENNSHPDTGKTTLPEK
jgi:peptide subunit release factor RF-3